MKTPSCTTQNIRCSDTIRPAGMADTTVPTGGTAQKVKRLTMKMLTGTVLVTTELDTTELAGMAPALDTTDPTGMVKNPFRTESLVIIMSLATKDYDIQELRHGYVAQRNGADCNSRPS